VRILGDGKRIVSVSETSEVIFWNRTTGEAIRRMKGPEIDQPFTQAAISPDGRFVLWSTEQGPIQVAELPAE
jgi:hypothetical protein